MADNYDETVEALCSLGMEDFARLLERAAEALFHGPVPRTLEERNEIIDALPEDDSDDAEDDLFDELNGEYFAKGGGDRALAALERWYFGDARPATA